MDAVSHLKKRNYLLMILDIRMPKTNAFGLLSYAATVHPQTRILVFSMCLESLYGKKVITAGAHGYLSKEASVEELRKAIDMILANKRYISDQLLELLIKKTDGQTQSNPFTQLSAREFEITSFLLSGMTVSDIAKLVDLQRSTVGAYKVRIFEKLNVSNVIELKELASLYSFY
jgi:two-component system, NarL family, invasion response regulator UvrY